VNPASCRRLASRRHAADLRAALVLLWQCSSNGASQAVLLPTPSSIWTKRVDKVNLLRRRVVSSPGATIVGLLFGIARRHADNR